jgi:predicted acylesterase/phospholipase RssA
MGTARPKIIINAAALGSVPIQFQFTEERFREFGSRLDTYPVSAAVVASGAFPGALHPVTIRNYLDAQRPFTHLYDGGVFDNLGVTPLIHIAENLTDPKGCLLIVVDSHQEYEENPKYQKRRDPRTLIDYFIDTNAIDAAGSLTSYQRAARLHLASYVLGLGLPSDTAEHPVQLSTRPRLIAEQPCLVWLISFNRLHWISARFKTLETRLNQIATRYTLTSPTKQAPRELQTSLYEAANILVQQDPEALAELCAWLRPRAIHLPRCMSKSDTN